MVHNPYFTTLAALDKCIWPWTTLCGLLALEELSNHWRQLWMESWLGTFQKTCLIQRMPADISMDPCCHSCSASVGKGVYPYISAANALYYWKIGPKLSCGKQPWYQWAIVMENILLRFLTLFCHISWQERRQYFSNELLGKLDVN